MTQRGACRRTQEKSTSNVQFLLLTQCLSLGDDPAGMGYGEIKVVRFNVKPIKVFRERLYGGKCEKVQQGRDSKQDLDSPADLVASRLEPAKSTDIWIHVERRPRHFGED